MEIKDIKEHGRLESLVSTKQGEFGNRREAAAWVALNEVNPPVSAEELESALGKARAFFYGGNSGAREGSAVSLYLIWLSQNDHVTSDVELAHFTGLTRQAFSNARMNAIRDGYELEKDSTGWNVVARPEKEEDEEVLFEQFKEWLKSRRIR